MDLSFNDGVRNVPYTYDTACFDKKENRKQICAFFFVLHTLHRVDGNDNSRDFSRDAKRCIGFLRLCGGGCPGIFQNKPYGSCRGGVCGGFRCGAFNEAYITQMRMSPATAAGFD